MVSFRFFPLLFSPPPNPPPISEAQNKNAPPACRNLSTAAALSLGAISGTAGFLISQIQNHHHPNNNNNNNPFLTNSLVGGPMWGCLSLSRAGMSFPALLPDSSSQRLLGVGLRRKAVLGFKNVDVYAFGVYADDSDIKNFLGDKYGSLSASELKGNQGLREDLMDSDVAGFTSLGDPTTRIYYKGLPPYSKMTIKYLGDQSLIYLGSQAMFFAQQLMEMKWEASRVSYYVDPSSIYILAVNLLIKKLERMLSRTWLLFLANSKLDMKLKARSIFRKIVYFE